MSEYLEFIAGKSPRATPHGIEPKNISDKLFGYQRACVEFLLRAGSGGLFLDTGLGKTLCELEWSAHAANATNGHALILTPLAVAHQIRNEAHRFGYEACIVRDQSDVREGINIANYDILHKLDPQAFGAVALDESSILKSFTGKTSRSIIDAFAGHRFKLSATATPAPNDHMELGQHAEFCNVMAANEMLSRFFINDTSTASQQWRLKRHGVNSFWDWMASWSRLAQMPSDLGFDDTGFVLPELKTIVHRAHNSAPRMTGGLFGDEQVSATNMHDIKRQTIEQRAKLAVSIIDRSETFVVWVDTDYEADGVMREIKANGFDGVVEVRGSMSPDKKEESLDAFADGSARILITKPSICGFGLNWQHCANTIFVGRSFSYESWYQAVRRFWRFGQKRDVNVHLIVAEGEDSIGRVIDRKANDHTLMKAAMREAMKRDQGKTSQVKTPYIPTHKGKMPSWISAA